MTGGDNEFRVDIYTSKAALADSARLIPELLKRLNRLGPREFLDAMHRVDSYIAQGLCECAAVLTVYTLKTGNDKDARHD